MRERNRCPKLTQLSKKISEMRERKRYTKIRERVREKDYKLS